VNEARPSAARFPPTRWSLVAAAAEPASGESRAALEVLCRASWLPLYAFARRSGSAPEAAEDLVQGFFAALLEKGYLAEADRERGRFRTFLLAAFRHHVSRERERERAQKRGGGVRTLALDMASGERLYLAEPADERTPERLFERRWALLLLERALEGLRQNYGGMEKSEVFETLRPFLVGGEPASPLADVGARLGLSEGAVKVALHRLRRRYRDTLRAAIAETVAHPAEIDDEIRHLLGALAG
jgi:RNA polymerase sigma factor (sigma-70 family)